MSITTGVCARMGPWPSSCGSTAWSPGAQIVCAGTEPSAMIRVFTAARRSSAREARGRRGGEAVAADAAAPQRGEARLEPRLRGAQRGGDRPHLVGALDRALGPERVGRDADRDAEGAQLLRQPDREAPRHLHRARAEAAHDVRRHLGHRRHLPRALDLARDPRPGEHAAHAGLLAGAVALEVAHHHQPAPARLREQERIGRVEAGRVEHVGVRLGRGVEQADGAGGHGRRGATSSVAGS